MMKYRDTIFLIFSSLFLLLSACASSDVSRDASNNIQSAYSSADSVVNGAGETNFAAGWDDASQMEKGLIIGGATGAVAGGAAGVGWIPGAAGGAIFGGALGAWIDSRANIYDQLRNDGANLMILGDQVRIVIPSEHLFCEDTAELNPYAYHTLDLVVKVISRYPNRTITIASYSDPSLSHREAITQRQSISVMKYLWRAGINTRLLYAVGYGGKRPVAVAGEQIPGDNDRIEISLEKLPV